ncbi:hypothetical protein DFJ77DRAFT_446882 [Powellomyces hirtus]|nr:hypothetical protein DFJ77DRAFT_446882 [Powellomyces hirtus]
MLRFERSFSLMSVQDDEDSNPYLLNNDIGLPFFWIDPYGDLDSGSPLSSFWIDSRGDSALLNVQSTTTDVGDPVGARASVSGGNGDSYHKSLTEQDPAGETPHQVDFPKAQFLFQNAGSQSDNQSEEGEILRHVSQKGQQYTPKVYPEEIVTGEQDILEFEEEQVQEPPSCSKLTKAKEGNKQGLKKSDSALHEVQPGASMKNRSTLRAVLKARCANLPANFSASQKLARKPKMARKPKRKQVKASGNVPANSSGSRKSRKKSARASGFATVSSRSAVLSLETPTSSSSAERETEIIDLTCAEVIDLTIDDVYPSPPSQQNQGPQDHIVSPSILASQSAQLPIAMRKNPKCALSTIKPASAQRHGRRWTHPLPRTPPTGSGLFKNVGKNRRPPTPPRGSGLFQSIPSGFDQPPPPRKKGDAGLLTDFDFARRIKCRGTNRSKIRGYSFVEITGLCGTQRQISETRGHLQIEYNI